MSYYEGRLGEDRKDKVQILKNRHLEDEREKKNSKTLPGAKI